MVGGETTSNYLADTICTLKNSTLKPGCSLVSHKFRGKGCLQGAYNVVCSKVAFNPVNYCDLLTSKARTTIRIPSGTLLLLNAPAVFLFFFSDVATYEA